MITIGVDHSIRDVTSIVILDSGAGVIYSEQVEIASPKNLWLRLNVLKQNRSPECEAIYIDAGFQFSLAERTMWGVYKRHLLRPSQKLKLTVMSLLDEALKGHQVSLSRDILLDSQLKYAASLAWLAYINEIAGGE